jgi:hypothetical protein
MFPAGNNLKFAKEFQAANVKFVRFKTNSAGMSSDTVVHVNEIKVYENRPVHAPFIGWKLTSTTSSAIRIRLLHQRTTNKGEYIRIYRQLKDSTAFTLMYNYGYPLPSNITSTINFGTLNRYYISAYLNGTEIAQSDTITIISQKATAVNNGIEKIIPQNYQLLQNYPNPFNPTTTIQYFIPQKSKVQIKVLDLLGREIATVVNEENSFGKHTVIFDASQLSSGMYFYRMQAENFVEIKKLVVIK